ncbi:MAG TPA: hypothetical protein VFX16_23800 [Pseudonocardiaceae bacterium]|nr:hypothetical protein [Pseudonocardiaceae bacterium]
MAEDEARRPKGRRGRRIVRESVIADTGGRLDDESGDEGSAGVREPRRPLPKPVSGAGVRPEPAPPLVAVLPDPRY